MYTKFNRLFVILFLVVLTIQPGSQFPSVGEVGPLNTPSAPEVDGSNENKITEDHANETQLTPKAELTQLGDTYVIIRLITPSQIGDRKFQKTKTKVEVDLLGNSTWIITDKVKLERYKSWVNQTKNLILYSIELKCSGLMSGTHYRISTDIFYQIGTDREIVSADIVEFTTKPSAPKVDLVPGPLVINFNAKDAVKYFVEVKKENDPDCFINITVSAKFSKSLAIPGLANSETYSIKVWYQNDKGKKSEPVSETKTIHLTEIVV